MKLKLQSAIASGFSVLFSMSIVTAITDLNTLTYVVLYAFATLFLLYNEDRKVRELRRKFRGVKYNLTTVIFTLTISIVLSSVGVFLWINKDVVKHEKIQTDVSKEKLQIEKKYNSLSDSISNLPYPQQYTDLQKELEWWKGRRPANLEERKNIRSQIADIQLKIDQIYNTIKKDRSLLIQRVIGQKQAEINLIKSEQTEKSSKLDFENGISLIFILMVLITEFVIINIQREIARKIDEINTVEVRTVKDLLNQNLKYVDVNDFKYHPFMEGEDFKRVKKLFNLLENLGIISNVTKTKDLNNGNPKIIIRGQFMGDKKLAIKELQDYYIKFNNLKK